MHEETFESTKGSRIFLRSWRPAISAARGVLVICHGFNAHSGQYQWVAEQFLAAGFAVYAPDLRGRGKSSGERFYVESFDDYVSDLAKAVSIAKSREPGLPVFLLGHSAGGVVSCGYTLKHQSELAGLICESFAFQVPAPDFALDALAWLGNILPHIGVLKLKNKDFSRDPKHVKALNDDPLIANETQPAKTVGEMWRADKDLRKSFGRITLPVFIIHGTADHATQPKGSQFFYDTAGSKDKTLKFYKDCYHDLLADIGKEAVLADIKDWIEKRLG